MFGLVELTCVLELIDWTQNFEVLEFMKFVYIIIYHYDNIIFYWDEWNDHMYGHQMIYNNIDIYFLMKGISQ